MTDRVNHGDGDSEKTPYVCEYCLSKIIKINSLLTSSDQYFMSFIGGFKHPGNFKQHLASHLRSGKPGLGEKRVVDENSLTQSGPSPKQLKKGQGWPCNSCNKEFTNEDKLVQHVNEDHLAAVSCKTILVLCSYGTVTCSCRETLSEAALL
jgi:hypothetical protein